MILEVGQRNMLSFSTWSSWIILKKLACCWGFVSYGVQMIRWIPGLNDIYMQDLINAKQWVKGLNWSH